jgi:5-formyltetrahydrofolate cyclo-ligase
MRRRREALSPTEISEASSQVARHLWQLPALSRAQRIAAYVAVSGEIDPAAFLRVAAVRRRRIYLPVLHGEKLLFAPAGDPGAMVRNRFGIPEPAGDSGRWLRGTELDVVLTPLVAFDEAGHRLGMGSGFYDRTFGFTARRGTWRHPWLVGVAYEFQNVAVLPARHWDVPLHAVVTPNGVRMF